MSLNQTKYNYDYNQIFINDGLVFFCLMAYQLFLGYFNAKAILLEEK